MHVIHHPGLARRGGEHVVQLLRVEAERLAEAEDLGGPGDCDPRHHVVADLRGLPVSRSADVGDVAPHRREDRSGAFEAGRGAAHHEREGRRRGSGDPARHRGVDHLVADPGCRRRHRPGARDVDGRAVGEKRLPRRMSDDAVVAAARVAAVAQVDRAHVPSFRQHGDHHLRRGDRIGQARRLAGAGPHRLGQRLGGHVVRTHLVARDEKVAEHRQPHVADADECDSGHWIRASSIPGEGCRRGAAARAGPGRLLGKKISEAVYSVSVPLLPRRLPRCRRCRATPAARSDPPRAASECCPRSREVAPFQWTVKGMDFMQLPGSSSRKPSEPT